MFDPKVEHLLKEIIDTPTKLQLLLLFCENPNIEGTARQLAERTFRDIWSASEALRELTEDGIVVAFDGFGELLYRYQPISELVHPIQQLHQYYNEPIERDYVQQLVREAASYAPYRRASHGNVMFERL